MTAQDCNIAILGAGPAGVACALGLAERGYRIALLDRPRRFPALEGLAERALAGLRHLACDRALSEVRVAARRSAYWNGTAFAGNREWLLDRERFDQALLADARAAGVRVLAGRAGRAEWRTDHWRIAGPEPLRARFLIDARGRSAPRDRTGRRGPLTLALARRWRLPGPAETRVLPWSNGWLWYACDDAGQAVVQLFIDARLPPRARLDAYYGSLLAGLPEARAWLAQAAPLDAVHARYAHMQCAADRVSPRHARVGDAAFAIDPLSGHGIYQALAGALALTATVNTLLARPGDTEAALAFYHQRIGSDFQRMARLGRDFYRQESRWPEREFWRRRQTWPDAEPVHPDPAAGPARIEARPVSRNGYIETREVIVSADQPRGVWQLDGVELVPLLRWHREVRPADRAGAAMSYAERVDRPPRLCQQALDWLGRRGLLE